MTIKMTEINGVAWLDGVYELQKSSEFLGSYALSKKIEDNKLGIFHIGFDNRIQPAQVRVFYEPPQQIPEWVQTIGLIQFCQYNFQGEPLPPEMYSPEIDYKNTYRDPVRYAQEQFWLDLMDPVNAYNRMRSGPLNPFYAYNGLLFTDKKPDDFVLYGLDNRPPNGSLLRVTQTERKADESLAASLIAPIGLDLDVLDDEVIAKEISRYKGMEQTPIFTAPYPPNDSETKALDTIQYVMKLLNDKKKELETNQSEKTLPIAENDIRWVKVIGKYIMIQFDDPEYVGGLICVYFYTDQTTWITAYNFDTYTFERWVIDANTYMFEQYIAYKKEQDQWSSYIGNLDAPRGRKPLKPSPFLNFKTQGQEIVVSFTYRTFSYAIGKETPRILGGVEWEVSRKFDLADLQWGMLEFEEPRSCRIIPDIPPYKPPYDLKLYYEVFKYEIPPVIRKLSSPTIWFANPREIVKSDRSVGFGERATNWIRIQNRQ